MLKKQGIVVGVSLLVILVGLGVFSLVARRWSWFPWGSVPSSSAITVNGQGISQQTFEQAYQNLISGYRASLSGEERANFERQLLGAPGAYYQLSLKAQVAETLIRQTILEQEARALKVQVSDEQVKEQTQEQLRTFLANNGVPSSQIEDILRDPKSYQSSYTRGVMDTVRQGMLEEGLRQKVVSIPAPTEAELESYYQENRLRYYKPALVRVRRLLIKLPKDAAAEELAAGQNKLEALKQQIDHGAFFSDLARQNSQDSLTAAQGGEFGWIQAGDPEGEDFVHLAFSLKPGEVGGPVRTQFGLELLQTEEIQPAQGDTFDKVAGAVRTDYIDGKTKDAFVKWFDARYDAAKIEIKVPLVAAFRLEQKDSHAAVQRYEAIRDQGKSDDPYLGYYIARLYRQDLDAAQARIKALPQDAPPSERTTLEGQINTLKAKVVAGLRDVVQKGRGDGDVYQAILEADPQDQEARFQLAGSLMSQGKRDEALVQLEGLLAQAPDHLRAQAVYGKLLFDMGRYEDAIPPLKRALEGWPQKSASDRDVANTLRLTLAQAERQAGQLEAARSDFEALQKLDPGNLEANRALGEMALDGGDASQAIIYYQAALNHVDPSQIGELQDGLGRAYLAENDLPKAQDAFQQALAAAPPAAAAYLGLGQIYQRQGLSTQAMDAYHRGLTQAVGWPLKQELAQRLLSLDPTDVDAHLTLGDIYRQSHQYVQAMTHYQAALARQPSVETYRTLGDIYLDSGKLDEALSAFRRALALQPAPLPLDASGLWARILSVERERAGKQPLSQDGLEALYQLAQLSLHDLNDAQKAANYLAQLRAADPHYRAQDVASLVQQVRNQGVDLPQTPSSTGN
jgi:tetratricopeptide (TPR) repeat protein